MLLQSLQRTRRWSSKEINATPAQFRKMLPSPKAPKDTLRLAVSAGKKMAMQLAKAGNTVKNLDREQVERWRRSYKVPLNRVNVMLMVAWSSLHYPKTLRTKMLYHKRQMSFGLDAPRDVAKQMVTQYGVVQAEDNVRSLIKQSAYKTEWRKVLRIVQSNKSRLQIRFKFAGEVISIPVAPLPPVKSLARQGAAKYRGYVARQQKFLRSIPKPIQTPQPVIAPPVRLVSEAEMREERLCISCIYKRHFYRNPVRYGGTVFCESCQP